MTRALLWLLPGVAAFLLIAVLLAPVELLGRALGLATIAVVPGLVVIALTADARRRRRRAPTTPDEPTAEERDQ